MNRLKFITAFLIVAAIPAAAQSRRALSQNFASDFQTVPVMSNTSGVNGANFQTFVALLNPTATAFAVDATLYDANGTKRTATINLAAGELRTYANFLDAVFHYSGGGAVTFRAPNPSNRFVVNAEVWTNTGGRYGTPISVLEFAGTASRSFSPGITVDSSARTNVGCFNQTDAANKVKATVLDATGKLTLGSVDLNLPANGWGQTALTTVVSNGSVQFDPSDSAVCYAVVVDNKTNDGRFISAAEYLP
ncbi:MAG TPA: hypothetical protein VJZ00_24065 [Thermoanaerobaculia bacterium]|nr:hypothetical protein [Thermoanaerobaculia bacterium]